MWPARTQRSVGAGPTVGPVAGTTALTNAVIDRASSRIGGCRARQPSWPASHGGRARAPRARARRVRYLSSALWEPVGQNVAVDLGRGPRPGENPARLRHGGRSEVSGGVEVCMSKARRMLLPGTTEPRPFLKRQLPVPPYASCLFSSSLGLRSSPPRPPLPNAWTHRGQGLRTGTWVGPG